MAELTPRMKELVQPYLAGIEPYDPNFTPTRINLSANENTYPVSAGVREASQRRVCFRSVSGRVVERGHVGPPDEQVQVASRCARRLRPCGTAAARRR